MSSKLVITDIKSLFGSPVNIILRVSLCERTIYFLTNPMFSLWFLSCLLVAMTPLVEQLALILKLVVLAEELPPFAYKTNVSDGNFNICNTNSLIQHHLYPCQDSYIV